VRARQFVAFTAFHEIGHRYYPAGRAFFITAASGMFTFGADCHSVHLIFKLGIADNQQFKLHKFKLYN
jgi:hypothetical protein